LIAVLLSGCGEVALPADRTPPGEVPAAHLVTVTPTQVGIADEEDNSPEQELGCVSSYFSAESDLPSYSLDASISISNHTVSVDERIVYPNTSADALESLPLIVETSRIMNVFSLSSVAIDMGDHEEYSLTDGVMELHLESPLPPGCAVEINLAYILAMPAQDGLFGYTDTQLILTNWYPFFPPYEHDQQWQIHRPGRYGEHLVYPMADFIVSLEFEEEISGEMVAAPAPANLEGPNLRYELFHARTFSLAVLPGHRHLSRTEDGTEFHVYFKSDSAAAAQAALETMVSAVEVFQNQFGAYPFESLTNAEIEMYDGMEFDGIFFLGRDVYPEYNDTSKNIFTLLVAHETAHNWWFSQIANDQAMDPWLDEAFCTYSELLYLEQAYPELVDWWWDFRVYDYRPVGPVDVSIYEYFDYERYRQSVYLRGALFFQAVRDQVGDDTFFEFIQKYYLVGKGEISSADLFFSTLEQVSDQEIDGIRSVFFKNP